MPSIIDQRHIENISSRLGVNSQDLNRLIQFESGWDPQAKNKLSSARGLLQFTDATSRSMGYKDSTDLVNKNPTIGMQLDVVEEYLAQFKPFRDKQDLYMSVFFPAARRWSSERFFPDYVRVANPGINTPGDYIRKVDRSVLMKGAYTIVVAGIAAALIYYFSKKHDEKESEVVEHGPDGQEEEENEFLEEEEEDG